jgi:hypothetical protein
LPGVVDLQLVAFPQQGIYGYEGGEALMRRAVEHGADVVGGIPHFELTREDGVRSVTFAFELAEETGCRSTSTATRPTTTTPGSSRSWSRRRSGAGCAAGSRQPHHGDALLQQRLREPPGHEHRPRRACTW